MHRAIAIDLTCLALGPLSWTPRGIDRVELAYARHFLEHWPGECFAVIPTLWGMRYFDRARAIGGLDALATIWREQSSAAEDAAYRDVKSFLTGHAIGQNEEAPERAVRRKPIWTKARDFLRLLKGTGFAFGKPVASLPAATVYLNVGQLLFFRFTVSWLKKRADIVGVFMIHDLLPLELPDHHVPLGGKLHRQIVRLAAEFADALIVPSQAVKASLQNALVPAVAALPPVHVELLPVSDVFLAPIAPDPELAHADYFIACGALEAHKNHMLLLEVWVKLLAANGAAAPKLVIAGFPSVTSKPLFDFVRAHPHISSHVIFMTGLSTSALRALVKSSRALLMPSVGEGFGLPIIEALAQGTAVIASDIPAHQEAGRAGNVTFLPPRDIDMWMTEIQRRMADRSSNVVKAYIPKRWHDYFREVEIFLEAIADKRARFIQ